MSAAEDSILSRRSVARVTQEPVDPATVRDLLAAAQRAPNHHLTAPWRFVVLAGDARRALAEQHAADVQGDGPPLAPDARERECRRLERAPVVLACIAHATSDDPVVRREDRDAVAAGVQNLLLVAHARGLGAIWRTGAMVDGPRVRTALGCGPDDAIVAFVYLGHPVGTVAPPTPRPRLDEVVEWRGMAAP